MDDLKQVIIVRKDLKMPAGKIAAQVAHASVGVVLDLGTTSREVKEWTATGQTKVVVSCVDETELLSLAYQAGIKKIPHKVVTDAGRTCFNGQPTKTCCAIGPAKASVIDDITRNLKLL